MHANKLLLFSFPSTDLCCFQPMKKTEKAMIKQIHLEIDKRKNEVFYDDFDV